MSEPHPAPLVPWLPAWLVERGTTAPVAASAAASATPAVPCPRPSPLTEPGMMASVHLALRRCHAFKQQYQYLLWNLGLLVGLVSAAGLILWFKYKGRPTPEEMAFREAERRAYILSRIQRYQAAKLQEKQTLITGLPQYEGPLLPM